MTRGWAACHDGTTPAAAGPFVVRHDVRPFTLNGERNLPRHERIALVRQWREAFGWLAKQARIPRLVGPVAISATPHLRSAAGMQDTAGCFPAVKAAIDGLVDAGVLPGDGPDVVRSLTFHAPIVDVDALELVVHLVPTTA